MTLVALGDDRPRFLRAAVMVRAHELGRYALAMCRTAADRNHQRSRCLKRAWAEATHELTQRLKQRDRDIETSLALAEQSKRIAALAAHYGDNRDIIEQAITREKMRDYMRFIEIARLEAALVLVASREQQR